jgi:hypothetical protein
MDAWTAFGLLRLFLDIIDEGPSAIVKGILMAGLPSPYGEMLDVGEVVFGLFDLNGNYQGAVTLREDQKVPFSRVRLLNREELDTALAKYDFPKLARRQFAELDQRRPTSLQRRDFKKRSFPKF